MKVSRLFPGGLLALALAGTGALMATAQTAGPDPDAPAVQVGDQSQRDDRGDPRGDHSGRGGHRGDHGGHRGHRGDRGGRGGSEMFAALFGEVDADDDGAVTQAEIDTYRTARVGEADASGDGALDISEFETLYGEFTRSRMVDAFQDLDADGDGVVGIEEMDIRFGDVVDRMDRDGDGALTPRDRGHRG